MNPLDPRVEQMLRGLARVEPPEGGRTRLLAALERRSSAPAQGLFTGRLRWALTAGASAASVVFALGMFERTNQSSQDTGPNGRAVASDRWEAVHAAPSRPARVRLVNDPRMAFPGAAFSGTAAGPLAVGDSLDNP